MTDVTVSLDEALLQRARLTAARDGKSLSRLVAEAVEQVVAPPMTQREALERFLAGPLMDLTDENGKAPTRDQLYD